MPELPLVGTDFAGYRLRSVLGRGGMSVVYQAENPRLLNLIALKVLAPDLAGDEVFRTRFREESQIAAALNHPNVIPIHDFGSYDGLLYIAMRYVSGTDLRHLIAEHGWLPPEATVYLLEQAARALDAAHGRGLVHRDVKPGNLLVAQSDNDGDPDHVYLADFGITKQIGGRTGLTIAGTVLGTVHYVSPEQIQERPVYGAADQYSLGCVLYECLTGQAPFERPTNEMIMWAHVHERPVLPTVLRPDLPPALDEVVARVLAKDPDDRYASCREFIADARDAIASARAFQSAPVHSPPGGFAGLGQPAARGRHDPTANAMPRGPITDPRSSDPRSVGRRSSGPRSVDPRSSGPGSAAPGSSGPVGFRRTAAPGGQADYGDRLDYGDQFDFADGPVRSRRVRRRRPSGRPGARSVLSLTAIAVSAAVIAGGAAAAGVMLSRTGDTTSAAQLTGALGKALQGTEQSTNKLTLSTCVQKKSTLVTCTKPDPAIESVTFRTFPTSEAMYTDYQQIVHNLTNEPFTSVQNQGADCSSVAPLPTGENTWNHSDIYSHKYTFGQMAAGKVPDDTAMGRVFCIQTTNGSEIMVWTQDFDHLLGYATGAESHEQVWQWFYYIHHSVIFNGEAPMPVMPGMSATSGFSSP